MGSGLLRKGLAIADAAALDAPVEAAATAEAIEAVPAIDVVEDEQAEAKVDAVSTSEVGATAEEDAGY